MLTNNWKLTVACLLCEFGTVQNQSIEEKTLSNLCFCAVASMGLPYPFSVLIG